MKIAVLDDDKTQLQLVEQALIGGENEWPSPPQCVFFDSGEALLKAVKGEAFDVVILDRQLPDMSGDVILQWLRQYSVEKFGIYTVVIMLTNLNQEDQELYGLRMGADDYLTKPFSPNKLVARIQRLYEMSQTNQLLHSAHTNKLRASKYKVIDTKNSPVVNLLGCVFNALNLSVTLSDGSVVKLTELEFNLAIFLLANVGMTISRQEIIDHVWDTPANQNQRTLDTHMHRMRTKLKLKIEQGFNLRTVYGHGYRLEYNGAIGIMP